MTNYGMYKLMMLLDLEGNVVATNTISAAGTPLNVGGLYKKNFKTASWFQKALHKEFLKGKTLTGTVVEQPSYQADVAGIYQEDGFTIPFAAPVMDEQGKTLGVWVNFADFGLIEEIIKGYYQSQKASGAEATAFALAGSGNVMLMDYNPYERKTEMYARDTAIVGAKPISAQSIPASEMLMSGQNGNGLFMDTASKLAMYVYDFSGHGISAAMNIFRMHTIMREFTHLGGDPGTFMANINRHLYPLLERNEFATMFYGVIDTEANCLMYATAAPTSPMLYSQQQKQSISLTSRGFPLGVVANASYETKYVPMQEGDMLLLFSDGLSEARGRSGECLGEDRVLQTFQHSAIQGTANPSKHVLEHVHHLLCSYSNEPLRDDLTISVYARNPGNS
jgi:hypothetical protein